MGFSENVAAAAPGYRHSAIALGAAMLLLCCAGCGGGGSNSPSGSSPSTPQALIVGDAGGTVLNTIKSSFQTVPGSGKEDPTSFAMIVFDGDHTDPAALQANPGVQNFLNAGKPLVILNETAAHLTGLSSIVWAAAQPSGTTSPAVAFFIRSSNGVRQELVQVDFPAHISGLAPGQPPPAATPPTDAQLADDGSTWLSQLKQMLEAPGNVTPADVGAGQTVLSFDHVVPLRISDTTILAWATSQSGGAPPSTTWGVNGSTPPHFNVDLSGAFETRVYAMLEGTSPATYQHKIFTRQYLLVSPSMQSFAVSQYPITGSSPIWDFPATARALLGWNSAFELVTQVEPVPGVPTDAITVTSNLPESQNGVVNLTTSESHTEAVSVSVTGGIQNETGVGTVGASWSDSWTWGQAQSVSFQDWAAQSCIGFYNPDTATCNANDLNASNYFAAFAGSDLTDAILRSPSNDLNIPWNNTQLNSFSPVIYSSNPNLNALQSSAMTNQTETTWQTTSSGGGAVNLLPPQTVTLLSVATVFTGEMDNIYGSQGPFIGIGEQFYLDNGFTSWLRADENVRIALNFGAPGLQPPGWNATRQTSVLAPWTLSFGQWSQRAGTPSAHVKGTLTLNQPSTSPTNLLLTYVVQPQSQILTMPSGQPNACPANTSSFIPGNVFSNQKPPLAITIPANKTSVTFPLTFQTFNTDTYNVQVVAWQTQTTIDGQTVINPQSAWCLTPPNTLP